MGMSILYLALEEGNYDGEVMMNASVDVKVLLRKLYFCVDI